MLAGTQSGTPNLTFSFNGTAMPSSGGLYKIVNARHPGINEISVKAQTANDIYESTGNDNVYASIIIAGNKVTINMPKIWALSASGGNDSVQIAANVTQE